MADEAAGLAEEQRLSEREDEVVASEDMEEGEIPMEDLPDGSLAPELEDKADKGPHPLEHAWTFWFDSPSAKSKNSAWGTSIRPIYTFQTVEDFWRAVDVRGYQEIQLKRCGVGLVDRLQGGGRLMGNVN
ncbi:Eukaryotic translation initiation factor 4E-1 [Platanthera guangdongensis]|uniref:eIF-4F 25 kDa subunit n=1 Tax=Platanthera guangdongensis TaxID=2320717 RepID=A0ABR2M325_9ASPA